MVTIASTPEKTLATLTGEECIPLSDKTHIKTAILKNLASLLNILEDRTLYRCEYQLAGMDNIAAVKNDSTISGLLTATDGKVTMAGQYNITVPHLGRYMVIFNECEKLEESSFIHAGSDQYGIFNRVTVIYNNVNTIAFTISGSIKLKSITIIETAVAFEPVAAPKETVEDTTATQQSYVDNNGCLTLVL